jgi:hypothetical protein
MIKKKTFWNHKEELSVVNGLLLKGKKIVIPGTLRLYTLKSMDPCSRLSNKILWKIYNCVPALPSPQRVYDV